ncbi:MAG: hypothetical protein KDA79_14900 [Planctomycetaceae bacterium]|nr:hypothetical protein [Planctomycetaceae bacterium]
MASAVMRQRITPGMSGLWRGADRWPLPAKILLAVLLVLLGAILQPVPVSGAQPVRTVRVQLASGRLLQVDRIELLPDSQIVVLHSSAPGVTMNRRLPASAIHSVTIAGRTVFFPQADDLSTETGDASSSMPFGTPPIQPVSLDESSFSRGALAPPPRELLDPFSRSRTEEPAPAGAAGPSSFAPPPFPTGLAGDPQQLQVFRPAAVRGSFLANAACVFAGSFGGAPGRVIGVRAGPLAAYADLIAVYFPFGVPASEAGAALPLLRAARARQMLAEPLRYPVPPALHRGQVLPHSPRPHVPKSPHPGGLHQSVPSAVPPGPAPPVFPRDGAFGSAGVFPAVDSGSPALDLPPNAGSLRAVAWPESLYGKSDLDSLSIEVQLQGPDGRPLPFSGTLSLRLRGMEVRAVQGFGPVLLAEPVREQLLASRTAGVTTAPGGSSGMVRLPLNGLPEHNSSLAPVGNLQVELVVPGRGVFATVVRNVPLAGHSQLEDWRLLTAGQRFSPAQPVHSGFLQAGTAYRRLRKTTSLGPAGRVFAVQP